jgi:hypothetical protein
MTTFDYDNLPEEIGFEPLPAELVGTVATAIAQALRSNLSLAAEAKAVYVYERKGYMEIEPLGKKRNSPYGSIDDDIVLQLTVRIPSPTTVDAGALGVVQSLEARIYEHTLETQRKAIQAQIAQAEADVAKAEAAVRYNRERLEELRKK